MNYLHHGCRALYGTRFFKFYIFKFYYGLCAMLHDNLIDL